MAGGPYKSRKTALMAAVNEIYDTSFEALKTFKSYASPLGEITGETFELPENENGIAYRLKITETEGGYRAFIQKRMPKWMPRRSKEITF